MSATNLTSKKLSVIVYFDNKPTHKTQFDIPAHYLPNDVDEAAREYVARNFEDYVNYEYGII